MFRRFCAQFGAALDLADSTSQRTKALRRSAERFLRAAEHGDDIRERDRPDMASLRDTVRRVLIAWVAITSIGTAPGDFGAACDRALLSATACEDLRRPVDELRSRVAQPHRVEDGVPK